MTHRVFEAITKEKISDEEAVRLFLDELDKCNILTEVRNSLRERGPKDLAVSLDAFREFLEEFTEADFEEDFLFDDQEDYKLDMLDEALTETGRSLEDIEIGEAMDIATAKENASAFIETEGKYAMVEED